MIPYLQSGTYTNTQRDNMNITAGLDIQPVKNWFIFFDYTYKLGTKEYEALNVSPLIYGADGVSTSKKVFVRNWVCLLMVSLPVAMTVHVISRSICIQIIFSAWLKSTTLQ